MKSENLVLVKSMMDYVFDSCRNDSKGDARAPEDRVQKFCWYIGWLEGNLLEFMTDEQAQMFMERIEIRKADYAANEAVFHDDEDGSFY